MYNKIGEVVTSSVTTLDIHDISRTARTFAVKNFYKPKYKEDLIVSFVMKKKIGNAVKRNKIRRKLKAIVQKLLKKRGAISKDYTYIVFGKSNAYLQKQSLLMPLMEKSFKTIKIK